MCRWRTARSAASCSAASPLPTASAPCWRWAAQPPPTKARAPRKPPCAASGSAIARIWAFKVEQPMAGISIERILALHAAYIRCIDRDELEAWPDFFLDPCLYVVTSAENHRAGFPGGMIYADTRGMLIDRVASLRGANVYEKQSYRHILGLLSILKKGGSEAETETPF